MTVCPCCATVYDGEECPNKDQHPPTFGKEGKPNILWYLFALPLIVIFATLHCVFCSLLTIFVHPARYRYKIYEYYAPWGWGKRK